MVGIAPHTRPDRVARESTIPENNLVCSSKLCTSPSATASEHADELWHSRAELLRLRQEAAEKQDPVIHRELREAEARHRHLARVMAKRCEPLDGFSTFGGLTVHIERSIRVRFFRVREPALGWLCANGYADVARELKQGPTKGSQARAHETKILKAFVREQLAAKVDLPWHRLGITVSRIARIHRTPEAV